MNRSLCCLGPPMSGKDMCETKAVGKAVQTLFTHHFLEEKNHDVSYFKLNPQRSVRLGPQHWTPACRGRCASWQTPSVGGASRSLQGCSTVLMTIHDLITFMQREVQVCKSWCQSWTDSTALRGQRPSGGWLVGQ